MTTTRDLDLRIAAFLAEGPSELSDRVYDTVRAEIDRSRQRVVIGPWREPRMSTSVRPARALAAVAVLAALVFGVIVIGPRFGGIGGPNGPTASPSAAEPSAGEPASPSPVVGASPPVYSWPHLLAAGTYKTSLIWGPDFVFTFTVPDGWFSRDINIVKGNVMTVQFYLVDDVTADVCREAPRTPPIDGSATSVAEAIVQLVEPDVAPHPITWAGRSGVGLEFTVGPELRCPADQFRLLRIRQGICGANCGGLGPVWKGFELGGPTEMNRLSILQVGRGNVVIHAAWTPAATADDLVELERVVESIEFATPNATPPPTPQGPSPSARPAASPIPSP